LPVHLMCCTSVIIASSQEWHFTTHCRPLRCLFSCRRCDRPSSYPGATEPASSYRRSDWWSRIRRLRRDQGLRLLSAQLLAHRLPQGSVTLQPGLPAQANGNDIVYDQRDCSPPHTTVHYKTLNCLSNAFLRILSSFPAAGGWSWPQNRLPRSYAWRRGRSERIAEASPPSLRVCAEWL